MQTIVSRTYTNVALTVILLLLLALVAQPYVAIPQAGAQPQMTDSQTTKVNPEIEGAIATREVAAALKDVASALREQATAQKEIGRAMLKLSSDAAVVNK